MSYQNGTTHYNLPQTVGTDKRDWFDTNEAFANLDSAVYGAVQTGAVNTQKIEDAETRVGQLNTRVEGVEGDVADIKVDVATAKEDIATQGTALSGLTTEVRDNKTDLEDMITAYEEATATASASHNVGDYFRYNNVLYITTITIRVGDTIVPDVNCRSTNVMTRVRALENQGGGQTPLASSVMYDNTTSGLVADNVQGAIDELDSTLDVAVTGVQSNAQHIGDMTLLQTTSKTDLVSAINEVLSGISGMLDISNYVKFTEEVHNLTTNTAYTTPIKGTLYATNNTGGGTLSVKVDNVEVASLTSGQTYTAPVAEGAVILLTPTGMGSAPTANVTMTVCEWKA